MERSIFKNMKTKILFTLPILVLVFLSVGYITRAAQLGAGAYFWGGTTSFDNVYQGVGGFDASTVDVPGGDGDISGYAWNGNGYGTLSFSDADVVGCPITPCNSRREGVNLKGWARLLAIKNDSSLGNSGGWQGWVQLDGVTVNASTNQLDGYAWSDELGFIQFSGNVTPGLVLRYGNCSGSDVENAFSLNQNLFKVIVACEGLVNVTTVATWSESGDDVVDVSSGTGDTKLVRAKAPSGTETLTATSGGSSDAVAITGLAPICVPNHCEQNTCIGQQCTDNCGSVKDGEKVCNPGGFKEVSP